MNRKVAMELAKDEVMRLNHLFHSLSTKTLTKLFNEGTGNDGDFIRQMMAVELFERKIKEVGNMDVRTLMLKVLYGNPTKEEREAWNLMQILSGINGECMDEDMAYWYERGCPVDDCPGFRG